MSVARKLPWIEGSPQDALHALPPPERNHFLAPTTPYDQPKPPRMSVRSNPRSPCPREKTYQSFAQSAQSHHAAARRFPGLGLQHIALDTANLVRTRPSVPACLSPSEFRSSRSYLLSPAGSRQSICRVAWCTSGSSSNGSVSHRILGSSLHNAAVVCEGCEGSRSILAIQCTVRM